MSTISNKSWSGLKGVAVEIKSTNGVQLTRNRSTHTIIEYDHGPLICVDLSSVNYYMTETKIERVILPGRESYADFEVHYVQVGVGTTCLVFRSPVRDKIDELTKEIENEFESRNNRRNVSE